MEQVNKKDYMWLVKIILFSVMIFFSMLIPAWTGMFIFVVLVLVAYVVIDLITMKKPKVKEEKILDILLIPLLMLTSLVFTWPVHEFVMEMLFLYAIATTAYYGLMKVVFPLSKKGYEQDKNLSLLEFLAKIFAYVGFFFFMFSYTGIFHTEVAKVPGDGSTMADWNRYIDSMQSARDATLAFGWLGCIFMTAVIGCLIASIRLFVIKNKDKFAKPKKEKPQEEQSEAVETDAKEEKQSKAVNDVKEEAAKEEKVEEVEVEIVEE